MMYLPPAGAIVEVRISKRQMAVSFPAASSLFPLVHAARAGTHVGRSSRTGLPAASSLPDLHTRAGVPLMITVYHPTLDICDSGIRFALMCPHQRQA